MKLWSPDDRRELCQLYPGTDDVTLAGRLGATLAEVQAEAKRLALSKDKAIFHGRPMPRWSQAELDRLHQLYPMHSNREIGRLLGRSEVSVSRKGARLGLRKNELRRAIAGAENVRLRRTSPPRPDAAE